MSAADSDHAAGFDISPGFERFAQRNDIYRRSFWDPAIRNGKTERFYRTYREPLVEWRKSEGFTQRDYALRNAAWHVSDLFTEARREHDRREGFSDPYTQQLPPPGERATFDSPQAAAAEIKRVGLAFGAGAVGITARDERFYNRDFSTRRARLWRWLAGTRARRLALWIDAKLGHGKRLAPSAWWGSAPKRRA